MTTLSMESINRLCRSSYDFQEESEMNVFVTITQAETFNDDISVTGFEGVELYTKET